MPREPLPIETWGKIRRLHTSNGTPAAIAYYRDLDGKRRRILRTAATQAQAERVLVDALKKRLLPASGYLSPTSTLTDLATKWSEYLDGSSKSPGTIRRYKSVVSSHLNKHVGELRIQEATVPRLQRIIDLVASDSPAQARILGVALTGMLDLAVRHGAARTNAAKSLQLPTQEAKAVKAPGDAELKTLFAALAAYDAMPPGRGGSIRDLSEFASMMLATGARIGEVLALQWDDFNIENWTVTIQSTLVNVPGKGLQRRSPKTASSIRTLVLPQFIRPMVSRRKLPAKSEWVFPSAHSTPRWPENVRAQWRDAVKGTSAEWVGPHDLRKAVATALGTEAAMAQLGHAAPGVTDRHYVEKQTLRPDQSAALEQLRKSAG